MGRITDRFEGNKYSNEAEVSQNFVIPLLTEFLEYDIDDIVPERIFRVFEIPLNRDKFIESKEIKQKPDFIICIDGNQDTPRFILDSKGPDEKLDSHFKQLLSYTLGTGSNLLTITNGTAFRVYNANDIIFETKSIQELDLNYHILKDILSKDVLSNKSTTEIIKGIDIDKALLKDLSTIEDERLHRIQLNLSDFRRYIMTLIEEFEKYKNSSIQNILLDEALELYSPEKLLRFVPFDPSNKANMYDRKYYFWELKGKFDSKAKLFIGPSGIGKTTLLRYITYNKALECSKYQSELIPVFVPLKSYGTNLSLRTLISNSFAQRGLILNDDELTKYLHKYSFSFMFDAYDEVHENYVDDLKKEILEILNLKKHEICITTRESRLVNLPDLLLFTICPLENDTKEDFVNKYLDHEKYIFLSEVERKGLLTESQNTLLLSFMVYLFKKERNIPRTKILIVNKIVDNIRKWETSKEKRFNNELTWEMKELFLCKLALYSAYNDFRVSLNSEQIDECVLPLIMDLEGRRELPNFTTKHQILDNLTSTGIISLSDGNISFYHRTILEYYASIAFSKEFLKDSKILSNVMSYLSWESILIGTTAFFYDSSQIIEIIHKKDLFLSATCAAVATNVDEVLIKKIISDLKDLCFSKLKTMRERAIYSLKKFDIKHTKDVFHYLIQYSDSVLVKMIALEEIAKERTEKAKEIVYSLINWDKSAGFVGTTQGSIAKALSNFEEEDHLKIIEIWKSKPDMFTDAACTEALLNIVNSRRATDNLKKEILSFYLSDENNVIDYSKKRGLSEILIRINEVAFIPNLIRFFDSKKTSTDMNTSNILASYSTQHAVDLIASEAMDTTNSDKIREGCARALQQSKGFVPLEIYKKLLKDKNYYVRMQAADGLDSFPTPDIKDLLYEHVECDENNFDGRVQQEIITILGERGLLVELLSKNKFPKRIVIDAFLEQVQKFRLLEFIPILKRFKKSIIAPRQRVKLAYTLYILGERKLCEKIIEEIIYRENASSENDYEFVDILNIAPNFEIEYAFETVRKVHKIVKGIRDSGGYFVGCCLEALERIGGDKAKDYIKQHALSMIGIEDITLIERTFRALNSIATSEDEDWYINIIDSNPKLKGSDLRRALEGLAIVGTEKSLQLLKKYAVKHKDDDYLYYGCIELIEHYFARNGLRKYVTEAFLHET